MMNRILGCLIIFLFAVVCCGCEKDSIRFRYANINTILGEERELEIVSDVTIKNIKLLNEDSDVVDIWLNGNSIYVKGKSLGLEKVKCKINDLYEISVVVNVVGERIYLDEFFNKNEKTYYIFFYKDNCKSCVETLPYALQYELDNGIIEDEDNKIYFCKFESNSSEFAIHRTYLGELGEGDSRKSKVTDVTCVEDLYIYSVPTIIKVDNGKLSFVADGARGVSNFIERLERLKNDDK